MDDNGTVAQIYREEYMDLCACKKGAKAVYYCNVKDCPHNMSRPTYCSYCIENQMHKQHAPLRVAKEIGTIHREFSAIRTNINQLHAKAQEKMKTFGPFINMCERLNICDPAQSIASDWELFKKVYSEF